MNAVRQRNVALILARELALNVSTPMWVWDEEGELIFANEHVQEILGSSDVDRLSELPRFEPKDVDGHAVALHDLPSAIALHERRPAHRELRIRTADGMDLTLSVTAFPLFASDGTFVGAVAVFWELGS